MLRKWNRTSNALLVMTCFKRWRRNQKLFLLVLFVILTFFITSFVQFDIRISWRSNPRQLMVGSDIELLQLKRDSIKNSETDSVKLQVAVTTPVHTSVAGSTTKERATKTRQISVAASTSKEITTNAICKVKEHYLFPRCHEKVKYLKAVWRGNCFKNVYHVDGSDCSILRYLSEIEPYCYPSNGLSQPPAGPSREKATMRLELDGLLEISSHRWMDWLRKRITMLWPDWVKAGQSFNKKRKTWTKKQVIVFPYSEIMMPAFFEKAGKGIPLGELVQWSDTIASLYILGYDIHFVLNKNDLHKFIEKDKSGCVTRAPQKKVDVIYTDINGITGLRYAIGQGSLSQYRCMYRILDSFGTEPVFNVDQRTTKSLIGAKSRWGHHNLLPSQFMTLYPHTPDNRFLGFVVGSGSDDFIPQKKPMALVYGKSSNYFKDYKRYLDLIHEYFEIHATATVYSDNHIPKYVINHGVVPGEKLKTLMLQSKLFVGLGFPYEGPGPIEAMAAGTVYLQPKYDTPKAFGHEKPTRRKVTSQNPYMENFVGKPYCSTIDINNEELLNMTLRNIKQAKPLRTKIPKEFTNLGMLERVYSFTESMNLCDASSPRWPPLKNMQAYVSEIGQSCSDLCMTKGLICERSYFSELNNEETLKKYGLACKSVNVVRKLHPPSMEVSSSICYLQDYSLLFSCSQSSKHQKRLCPCRDYEPEQSAICQGCL